MASREIMTGDGLRHLDHGAQYVTARSPEFTREIAALMDAGVVRTWSARGEIRREGHSERLAAEPRYAGAPCMNAWPAWLAHDLEVSCGAEVTALLARDGSHALQLADGSITPDFEAVVVAIPAPQAAALLATAAPALAAAAEGTVLAPCWAAWCVSAASPLPPIDALRLEGGGPIAWVARQAGLPGDRESLWLMHASVDWSREHLEAGGAEVGEMLIRTLETLLDCRLAPRLVQWHRWRHALVERPMGTACQWDSERRLGTCGDWHLGPRVELAWRSGEALAAQVIESLTPPD